VECIVCMGRLLQRIFSCPEGHSMCEECHKKLPRPHRCPQCRVAFQAMRNRALEAVVERCSFSCEHGCGMKARPAALLQHQSQCLMAPTTCPWDLCNERMQPTQLLKHIEEKHLRHNGEGDDCSVLVDTAEKRGNKFVASSDMAMMVCPEDYAYQMCILFGKDAKDGAYVKAAKRARIWHVRVFHIGSEHKFTMTFGEQGGRQASFADRTEPIRSYGDWDPDSPTRTGRGNGFIVAHEKMEGLAAQEDGNLMVSISCEFTRAT